MDQSEWLKSLKAGDEVAVSDRWGYQIKKIDKVTPTGQIKIGTDTFKNGWKHGKTTWDYSLSLEPVTQEIRNGIKRKALVNILNNSKFDKYTLEQLEQIINIIEPTESTQA